MQIISNLLFSPLVSYSVNKLAVSEIVRALVTEVWHVVKNVFFCFVITVTDQLCQQAFEQDQPGGHRS